MGKDLKNAIQDAKDAGIESLDDLLKALSEDDEEGEEQEDEDEKEEKDDDENEDEEDEAEKSLIRSLVDEIAADPAAEQALDAAPFLDSLLKSLDGRLGTLSTTFGKRLDKLEKSLSAQTDLTKSVSSALDEIGQKPAPQARQHYRVLAKGGNNGTGPVSVQAFRKSLHATMEQNPERASDLMVLGAKLNNAMTNGDQAAIMECMAAAPVDVIATAKTL